MYFATIEQGQPANPRDDLQCAYRSVATAGAAAALFERDPLLRECGETRWHH